MVDDNYVVLDIPSKGKGLVATTRLSQGTRILAESPLLEIPAKGSRDLVLTQFSKLSDAQQQSFYNLSNSHPDLGEILGIFETNGLCLPGAKNDGLYLKASRINHSCKPNAQGRWDDTLQKLTVHAIINIEKDEEITISYFGDLRVFEQRQRLLKEAFGFDCACRLCSLPLEQRDAMDKRIKEIEGLHEMLDDEVSFLVNPIRCLHSIHKVLPELESEGIVDSTIPRLYTHAFKVTVAHSDLARTKIFCQRALASRVVPEGHESLAIKTLVSLIEEPSRHEFYGWSERYKSSVEDAPKSLLDQTAFENWLWHFPHSQLANLRNVKSFPVFEGLDGLPEDIELASPLGRCRGEDFHDFWMPRKHWVFLGEIVHIEAVWRVRLIVKDKAGHQLPVAFYTETRGREIAASMLRVGRTVAILYAAKHVFMDGTVGIRHEDLTRLQILPVSLNDLLLLNDKVQSYSVIHNETRTCHGCNKQSGSLMKCSKCGFFWYCNQDCQTRGLNERGHKMDCKLLRNENVKGLFLVKWSAFEKHISFPLNVEG